MSEAHETDGALAARLAQEAGRVLLALRSGGTLSGKELGAAADRAAHELLCRELRDHRPADGLLSEEGKDDPARLARQRVWIVDPLDGTREYGEGRADWAVHVGLAVDGVPVAGAVALPGLTPAAVLRSDRPQPLPPPRDPPRLVVSRTRPPRLAQEVAEALGGALVPMGSAGAKAMAVVRGEAEIYLHAGGQYEWDSMAPVAVALAHGLHCSRLDGSPLRYNQPDTYLPDLLICRPELAPRVLALVADAA
ncbi:MAG: 3'(2'),5'-bisphosphate nucleotidase CysQ [Cypionkella sp.]